MWRDTLSEKFCRDPVGRMRGEKFSTQAKIWQDSSSVIVLEPQSIRWREFDDVVKAAEAVVSLTQGKAPENALGKQAKVLPLAKVQSIEWVSTACTLLVKFAWWRDPWRIKFNNPDLGSAVAETIGERVGDGTEPETKRLGPNDLQMDPRVGLPVLGIVIGLIAFVGGAVEGPAEAPLVGPVARIAWLADLGAALGINAVMLIGSLVVLIGMIALVYWFLTRPTKLVYRRSAAPHTKS
jgi:hypothetical protein